MCCTGRNDADRKDQFAVREALGDDVFDAREAAVGLAADQAATALALRGSPLGGEEALLALTSPIASALLALGTAFPFRSALAAHDFSMSEGGDIAEKTWRLRVEEVPYDRSRQAANS